ncbi:hypothetical protein C4D60_Mb02t22170 [Musa balbisiana]|uniref:Uncharacterized protein n=1 Tax=Musa balbisiana TaxID=52838 RepID=A0A4S8ICJ8_MUSBA|nr:hypothetical protein C4D60_Mb02t22170 [Musa balbisiana]
MDCPRAILRLGVTRERVDEGRLPKERTKSKLEEALQCGGRDHKWRDHNSSSFHKDQKAMEMSPGGDRVQRIVVEQFVAMRYTRGEAWGDLKLVKTKEQQPCGNQSPIHLKDSPCLHQDAMRAFISIGGFPSLATHPTMQPCLHPLLLLLLLLLLRRRRQRGPAAAAVSPQWRSILSPWLPELQEPWQEAAPWCSLHGSSS